MTAENATAPKVSGSANNNVNDSINDSGDFRDRMARHSAAAAFADEMAVLMGCEPGEERPVGCESLPFGPHYA